LIRPAVELAETGLDFKNDLKPSSCLIILYVSDA